MKPAEIARRQANRVSLSLAVEAEGVPTKTFYLLH